MIDRHINDRTCVKWMSSIHCVVVLMIWGRGRARLETLHAIVLIVGSDKVEIILMSHM